MFLPLWTNQLNASRYRDPNQSIIDPSDVTTSKSKIRYYTFWDCGHYLIILIIINRTYLLEYIHISWELKHGALGTETFFLN